MKAGMSEINLVYGDLNLLVGVIAVIFTDEVEVPGSDKR